MQSVTLSCCLMAQNGGSANRCKT